MSDESPQISEDAKQFIDWLFDHEFQIDIFEHIAVAIQNDLPMTPVQQYFIEAFEQLVGFEAGDYFYRSDKIDKVFKGKRNAHLPEG